MAASRCSSARCSARAAAADARTREVALLSQQTDLRLRSIDVERLPSVSALGQSQYQSDAPSAPFNGPDGQPVFASPKFTYDASLRVDQRLYDASIQPRRDLARADLAESQARVRTALFALRQEVNDAFFGAALLQEQLGALTATLDDLEGRLSEMTRRVREGTALPGRPPPSRRPCCNSASRRTRCDRAAAPRSRASPS